MNRLTLYIGPALRLMRVRRRLRQTEVARRATITRAMLSMYENGHRLPSIRSLSKVLDALDAALLDLARAVESVKLRTPRR